jgi:hypothetical protein
MTCRHGLYLSGGHECPRCSFEDALLDTARKLNRTLDRLAAAVDRFAAAAPVERQYVPEPDRSAETCDVCLHRRDQHSGDRAEDFCCLVPDCRCGGFKEDEPF